KNLKKITTARNKNVRMDFIQHMSEYPAHYLGFLDETSKNDRTYSRNYGRAKKGKRAQMKQKLLLTLDGMVANKVVGRSMKRADYLVEHEMPLTTLFPGPLSVLVMDNARIHHGEETLDLAE
ncbi:hypothetical protein B0H19DRAFT_931392, partial [Mycena capillaripes]